MEEFIIAILFIGALIYLGRHLYNQYRPGKEGCGSTNCGCDTTRNNNFAKPK